MRAFPLLCLTLVRTIAVVALTRPPCHRLRRYPPQVLKTLPTRSNAHANVAGARWLQGRRAPSERPGHPWGFSAADAWKMASRYTWGSSDRATRGHLRPSLPVGSFAYAFTDRRLLCSKHWCSQPRFGAVLDGGFAAARQIRWRATHNLHGLDNSKEWSKHPFGEHCPRPDESTVG